MTQTDLAHPMSHGANDDARGSSTSPLRTFAGIWACATLIHLLSFPFWARTWQGWVLLLAIGLTLARPSSLPRFTFMVVASLTNLPFPGRPGQFVGRRSFGDEVPRIAVYDDDFGLAPAGSPVVAPADGIVRLAEPDLFFTGATVMVDHGHGLTSVYSHLSAVDVAVGQRVRQGEPIGKVGRSGRATGAHLDWRVNWFTERLDPALLVSPMPDG